MARVASCSPKGITARLFLFGQAEATSARGNKKRMGQLFYEQIVNCQKMRF